MIVNLLMPEGNWRPLQLFTKEPEQIKQEISGAEGRTITVNLFKSGAQKPKTGLLLYTPLIGPGPEDPRLKNLATTFARGGFLVAIPWREGEKNIVSQRDVGDVVSTALFLLNNEELQIDRLGLFGLSYGAGPIIVAAADQGISKDVDFVVSFAGYYDLENTARFVMTGEFEYNDIRGKLEPDSYAKYILEESIKHYNLSEEDFLKSQVFEDLRQNLSPSSFISQLTMEFFIVHSTDDRYIPYTESMRLYDALKDRVPTHFALTTIFEHGDYKPLTRQNFREAYLPSITDFYNFLFLINKKVAQ